MAKSPGHRQHPSHHVTETPLKRSVMVEIDGQVIAESNDVIRVDEDDSPPRYYFKRDAMHNGELQPTATSTRCPYKGTANYFDLVLGKRRVTDAVWSYETPYDEHAALKDRIAFHDDRHPEIKVHASEVAHA